GAAVVTHLHAAAVPAALQLDHPRLPVDERDLPAQVLAIRASVRIAIGVAPVRIAIGVAISIVIPAVMAPAIAAVADVVDHLDPPGPKVTRSEEHTSELQSRENLVCRLLLEKKKRET